MYLKLLIIYNKSINENNYKYYNNIIDCSLTQLCIQMFMTDSHFFIVSFSVHRNCFYHNIFDFM